MTDPRTTELEAELARAKATILAQYERIKALEGLARHLWTTTTPEETNP